MRLMWLYAATLRHLRPAQIFWRIWYRLIWWPTGSQLSRPMTTTRAQFHGWVAPIDKPQTHGSDNSFTFLNRKVTFDNEIDWEHNSQGRLWTYNLHYFDFLNAPPHSAQNEKPTTDEPAQQFIQDWIDKNAITIGTGWEPYPTSLRIVNWIKWALNGHTLSAQAQQSLYAQAQWLSRRIEHHILANHLFTNLKALCFAAFFFDGAEPARWRRVALSLLDRELDEQFLADGAHFETSPMYHDILLEDVLDLINLLASQQLGKNTALQSRLSDTAGQMLRWSLLTRHPDRRIPFFNDAAFAIAPSIDTITAYADRLSIEPAPLSATGTIDNSITHLRDSGFVILRRDPGYAIFDAGSVGPDYQPGHTHADSLSFEYSWGSQRVFVNSGTSTYTPGELRESQRSTRLHNTVEIDGRNSTEVWGAFRVASRARSQLLATGQSDDGSLACVEARHNGYSKLRNPVIHTRKLTLGHNCLEIEDKLSGRWNSAVARFYLHPAIEPHGANSLTCPSGQVFNLVTTGGYLRLSSSKWYPEFGLEISNHCLEFVFSNDHIGSFTLHLTAVQ